MIVRVTGSASSRGTGLARRSSTSWQEELAHRDLRAGTPGGRPRPDRGDDRPGWPAGEADRSPWAHAGWAALAAILAAAGLVAGALLAAVVVGAALAVATLWALAAVAGLALGAVACGTVAGGYVAGRLWVGSRPYRGAARVALAGLGASAARAAAIGGAAAARGAALGSTVALRAAAVATRRGAAGASAASLAALAGARGLVWRPDRRERGLSRRAPLTLTGTAVMAVLALVVAAGPGRMAVGVLSGAIVARGAPIALPPLAQRSTVYAADGAVIGVFHADDNRQPVKLSAVAPVMVKAVIDTEDARFWHHGGVDLHAILRAVRADVGSAGPRQGASTIAEQLVKNLLLANRPDDLRTKVQEAVLADRLESRIGKRAVLDDYLNTVYFGQGAYGVQAAAETYFDVPASALRPTQAALLAGLIQDPTGYDPLRHPDDAAERRDTVLGLMVAAGDLRAKPARADARSPLPTSVHLPPSAHGWFLDAVEQQLLSDPRLGPTAAARYRAVFDGGLRIHTTFDPRLEAAATRAVTSGVPGSPLPLSAALAAVDPATGAVPAVVGGTSYGTSQFDAATAVPGRQTGSAFKLFTLVAALESGYSPNDFIDGSGPCVIPNPGGTPDPWRLSNYESENFGSIDITTATVHSVNCAFARLALMVGSARIAQVAHQMGITAPLQTVPSMTLGTNDVPPLQMASAYATVADGGVYHRPHLVTEVDGPDGRLRLRNDQPGVRVMSPEVAREATAVLEQVVLRGTGTAAAVPGRPVAGKTGTTAEFQDAWFVGFSPQLAAAVWMGDLAGEVPMTDVGGISVAGGTYPARIWSDFMTRALTGAPVVPLPAPDLSGGGAGVTLVPGQPGGRDGGTGPGAGSGAAGGHTLPTTWCWSSCGR